MQLIFTGNTDPKAQFLCFLDEHRDRCGSKRLNGSQVKYLCAFVGQE